LIYRYRPASLKIVENGRLVEKKVTEELENQELFFATIDENNDPMDGLQEVYWDGDQVLWKNLIRHYCLCMLDALITIDLLGDTGRFDSKYMRIWLTPEDLKTAQLKNLYDTYANKMLSNENVQALLRVLIARKKLYRQELESLLFLFNPAFMVNLSNIWKETYNCSILQAFAAYVRQQDVGILEKYFSPVEQDHLRALAEITNYMNEELCLITKYNNRHSPLGNFNAKSNIINFVTFFQRDYLRTAVHQIYPEYYLSCFSRSKDNCSLWSHYAEKHCGICLIFQPKTDATGEYIEMENGEKTFLTPIKYDDNPPELNYFANISHLSLSKLQRYWLCDGQNQSGLYDECLRHLHEGFWKKYTEKTSLKFKDRKYENETRALKHASGFEKIDKHDRVLRYKFEQLHGVIFGLRTTEDIQLEIMQIVEGKMKLYGHRDFGFYRAEYSSVQRKLIIRKFNLMKYEQ
jgi:hypothetical protein